MDKDPALTKLLLIGIPLEWRDAISASLENVQFVSRFTMSKDEAVKIIQSGELSAVIITSDLVFDGEINRDMIALTYGKIPTLTIILEETFQKFGQGRVFDKVYNPKAFQEFCTTPFDMDELLLRLRKIIQKAQKAALD